MRGDRRVGGQIASKKKSDKNLRLRSPWSVIVVIQLLTALEDLHGRICANVVFLTQFGLLGAVDPGQPHVQLHLLESLCSGLIPRRELYTMPTVEVRLSVSRRLCSGDYLWTGPPRKRDLKMQTERAEPKRHRSMGEITYHHGYEDEATRRC